VVLVTVEVVLDGHVEKQAHVGVGNPVEHLAAVFAGSYQTGKPQLPELMARGRFAHLRQSGKIAHAELTGFEQGVDHPEPARIPEQFEALGQKLSRFGVENPVGERTVMGVRLVTSLYRRGSIVQDI
jgi:hypothetical protein